MTETPASRNRLVGTVAIAIGVIALVGYGVFGASPSSPDLPSAQLALAALLVVGGGAIRQGRGPRWGEFVVGALVALLAFDLVNRLLG